MSNLKELLAQPFLLLETGDWAYAREYSQCGGLTGRLATRLGTNEAETDEILHHCQSQMKREAQEYFDEVMSLSGSPYPWPYGVWLPLISECVHHLLLVGETGSGKSYLAKVILCVRSWFGQVVVLDPHAIQPNALTLGDWGVVSVGAGRKYSEISAQMEALLRELSRRYEQRSEGVQAFEYLNIFVDEWPSIKAHCPEAAAFMKTMSREGRKVGMRLIILTQSPQVESLGLKGEGDTKENFSIIFLGKFARRQLPENWRGYPRLGYLLHQDQGYPISTDNLDWLTDRWLDLSDRITPPVWVKVEKGA